jgi:hypothetical protein
VLVSDLHLYLLSKHAADPDAVENKKFRNPVRFSYLESYRYLLI